MELKIGWLYPTLMSTYGDRGNVICLKQRSQWRGIDVSVISLDQQADAAQFHNIDVFVGGGAQDRQQEIVMRDLRAQKLTLFEKKSKPEHQAFLPAVLPNY